MRRMILAGGPRDGDVLRAALLSDLDPPPEGYRPFATQGATEARRWQDADIALFVHVSLPPEERQAAAYAAWDKADAEQDREGEPQWDLGGT